MGPFGVVLLAKLIEDLLLARAGALHRLDRAALHRAMHALMRPILLRLAWVNALMHDAEAQPPDVQIGQPVTRLRGERHAVVGRDGPREPVLAEGALEAGFRGQGFRGEQSVAHQQETRVLVGDGERIAVHPVPGPELALEVGRPEVVRRPGADRHHAGC